MIDSAWGESTNEGVCIMDVAVADDLLYGYEIKSGKDTLARLPHQVEMYNKVFDSLTIVVGERYFPEIVLSPTPPFWWGLILCAQGKMRVIKEPERNPRRDWKLLAKLLWRDESLEVLERYNCAKGMRNKTKDALADQMVTHLTFKQVHSEVLKALKEREYDNPKHSRQIGVIDCWTIHDTAIPEIKSTTNVSVTSLEENACSATSGLTGSTTP